MSLRCFVILCLAVLLLFAFASVPALAGPESAVAGLTVAAGHTEGPSSNIIPILIGVFEGGNPAGTSFSWGVGH